MASHSAIAEFPAFRPWNGFGLLFVCVSVGIGALYVAAQWFLVGSFDDTIFVGLLMANSYIVYSFAKFLKKHLERVAPHYQACLNQDDANLSEHDLVNEIYSTRSIYAGVLFGLIFFVFIQLLTPWGDPYLNMALGAFVMSANVVVGMAIYSMLVYFAFTLKLEPKIVIELWDRSSPVIAALIDTRRYIVYATSIIACIGMLSIFFSKFMFQQIIYFSLFSLFMVAVVYFVPLVPITAQLRRKKDENLKTVRKLMEEEYRKLLRQAHDPESPIERARFEALSKMYRDLKSVRAFPPVGERSINTAAIAALLTMFPTVMEKVLPFLQRFMTEVVGFG